MAEILSEATVLGMRRWAHLTPEQKRALCDSHEAMRARVTELEARLEAHRDALRSPLWEGETHQYEGYHDRPWSFVNPGLVEVPEGTKVMVVRA